MMDVLLILGFWFVIVSILVPVLIWAVIKEIRRQGEMTRRHIEAATENLGELLKGKDAGKDEDHREHADS